MIRIDIISLERIFINLDKEDAIAIFRKCGNVKILILVKVRLQIYKLILSKEKSTIIPRVYLVILVNIIDLLER